MFSIRRTWLLTSTVLISLAPPQCSATEQDTNAFCKDWAAVGECTTNSVYMRLHCPASCKVQLPQHGSSNATKEATVTTETATTKHDEQTAIHFPQTRRDLELASTDVEGKVAAVASSMPNKTIHGLPDAETEIETNSGHAVTLFSTFESLGDHRCIYLSGFPLVLVGVVCFLHSHRRSKGAGMTKAIAEPVFSPGHTQHADCFRNVAEIKAGNARASQACDQTDDSEATYDMSKELELSLVAEAPRSPQGLYKALRGVQGSTKKYNKSCPAIQK
eukprot:TRINITY_DN43304_c0_g1_i1.p1 TRINITY_DN43304_c0_g1~~TRINITY_DN43304_c0_g1_i1.p1  ORF type:complete len:275 (+),score=41.31 TRINITY_DN43304_c0_g1_i1:158-982(+)